MLSLNAKETAVLIPFVAFTAFNIKFSKPAREDGNAQVQKAK